ncbi:MAG TPA: phosphoribosylanthranilate isomerase [Candidatus Methanofastidiosa archaeon]|nr:phosphoribosylanthranilate isomerase [Candidatus Methanofastidiosa archaeon]
MPPFIKVCGIRSIEEADMLARYADATGVVVKSESARTIGLDEAGSIIRRSRIPVFLVSTATDIMEWKEMIERTRAGHIQVHSDMPANAVERIKGEYGVEIMKAFMVPGSSKDPYEEAESMIENIREYEIDKVLLDTGAGSGMVHDTRVSRAISERIDTILAGGLNERNILSVFGEVRPCGVDVSSGVERNGIKNEGMVRRFCNILGCREDQRVLT